MENVLKVYAVTFIMSENDTNKTIWKVAAEGIWELMNDLSMKWLYHNQLESISKIEYLGLTSDFESARYLLNYDENYIRGFSTEE